MVVDVGLRTQVRVYHLPDGRRPVFPRTRRAAAVKSAKFSSFILFISSSFGVDRASIHTDDQLDVAAMVELVGSLSASWLSAADQGI